jgi:hypothetical protein
VKDKRLRWTLKVKVKPYFKWYDFWVGVYIKRYKKVLTAWPAGFAVYVGIFPMIGVMVEIYFIPVFESNEKEK